MKFFGPDGKLIYKTEEEEEDLTNFNLNKRQIEALTKMTNENYKFSYKTYCEYFNISKSTCKRDLNDLLTKKLIKESFIDKTKIFYVENWGSH